MLHFGQLTFTVVLFCSQRLQSLKDILIDFPGHASDKEMFDFSYYSTESKYHDDSNKLAIGKMKDETGSVAIEEFIGLKPKMYSFLVDNNEHK